MPKNKSQHDEIVRFFVRWEVEWREPCGLAILEMLHERLQRTGRISKSTPLKDMHYYKRYIEEAKALIKLRELQGERYRARCKVRTDRRQVADHTGEEKIDKQGA